MTKEYKAIECAVYDQYELAAIRKHNLKITLKSGETFRGRIQNLQTESDGEYMLLNSGEKIRLDFISHTKTLEK